MGAQNGRSRAGAHAAGDILAAFYFWALYFADKFYKVFVGIGLKQSLLAAAASKHINCRLLPKIPIFFRLPTVFSSNPGCIVFVLFSLPFSLYATYELHALKAKDFAKNSPFSLSLPHLACSYWGFSPFDPLLSDTAWPTGWIARPALTLNILLSNYCIYDLYSGIRSHPRTRILFSNL